ncbi:helix-turn-helix domain-containing protein [Paraburkholderia bannensis]|uniref:helix-turn-helix domain-containing protein n=1 Tax=Paraburkholderia bannensis TaxID=765414 RepID=UPI0006947CA2|nr:helix-turn-helix transcriptional regulator [Paraburkholderia bannensis]
MARVLPQPVELAPGAPTLAALGRLVRNRRAQSALRIDDAADQIGVSKDVLSRLENGRPIGLDKLFLILDGLGLSLLVLPRADASEVLDRLESHKADDPTTERR